MVIVAGVLSLLQHVITLKEEPKKYDVEYCPQPHCGKAGLWGHGYRYRKACRENNSQESLNPIPIPRRYCPTCKHTCSVLPECIAPLRWYLWLVQQTAMRLFFSGMSFNKMSKTLRPTRWTLSRWIARLANQFALHVLHLKTKWPSLGYNTSLTHFWSALLHQMDLSHAMLFLSSQGIFVP